MERYGYGANLSSEQGAHLAVLCHDKLNGPVMLSVAFGKTFVKGFIPSLSCSPWTNTTLKKNLKISVLWVKYACFAQI